MLNRNRVVIVVAVASFLATTVVKADVHSLMKSHCGKCHSNDDPEGDFHLRSLGSSPDEQSAELWVSSVELVKSGEMPPEDANQMTDGERDQLIAYLEKRIQAHDGQAENRGSLQPRRLNNRELINSVADVLMIEDVGTHQPMANLIGDTLHEGFDTNGDVLGISEYHLDQYIDALRKVIDATILPSDRPETKRYSVGSDDMVKTSFSQRQRSEPPGRRKDSLEIHDMRRRVYFSNFQQAPATGRYRIKIRASGIDRGVYDESETGVYDGDPIRLRIHLGDRVRTFDLLDNEVTEIELDEWIVAGTRLEISYPTDGLRQRSNGNFKFQYGIAHDHLKQHDPKRWKQAVVSIQSNANRRKAKTIAHWSNWIDYWQGPRPRLFNAEVEGPLYETWPPKRQVALIGDDPQADQAKAILSPIARRAWRREVRDGELNSIVRLVQSKAPVLGEVEAFKEGILAILVSPSFLLINSDDGNADDRFATKFSYFLKSTAPDDRLRNAVRSGSLASFESVRSELFSAIAQAGSEVFLREFPQAWLQLDRISFMAPDPDQFPLYDRKRLSEDMIGEVLAFFRHAIKNNVPIPELLTADYSFVNADLAEVYGIENVPHDSKLRKHTFSDGRRGGLLGMGAFLTLTADSLGTSPIHRAVYVMENFMGTRPTPPPADVKITEPDVRQAKTIKEILAAHTADASCASCHRSIDPYGYAFENFGPMGEWRDVYPKLVSDGASTSKRESQRNQVAVPVDASAKFRSGDEYEDIVEFRRLMKTASAEERFVRCFVMKLLTYANGIEPENYSEVKRIVDRSAKHDYRIVDTIAAVVDSPLFRNQ